MELTGEYRIEAPLAKVWGALNDPLVLKRCIDGCQSLDKTSDTGFSGAVQASAGAANAVFQAQIDCSREGPPDSPPKSCALKGRAEGGAAGMVQWSGTLELDDAGEATQLVYRLTAEATGALALLSPEAIDAAMQKRRDSFFARLAEALTSTSSLAVDPVDSPNPARESYEPSKQWVIWAIMFGVLLLAVLLTF